MLAFPPDITFFIQLVSFLLLAYLMNRLLFLPYLDLLEERDARTTGDAELAVAKRVEADELAAEIEAKLAAARAEAMGEVELLRRDAKAEEAKLFDEAKREAAATLSSLRAGIAEEREAAAATLRDEAETLAGDMVTAVLSGKGASA